MSDRMGHDTGRAPLNEHAAQRRRLPPEDMAQHVEIAPGLTADGMPRPKRTRRPFGSMEQKLQWPDREGFHRHWFNDDPGRLIRADEAGYTKVNDEDGKPVQCVVGTARGGGPLIAYLHETPQQWFDEDMAAQEAVVMDLKRQIERGEFERPGGADGRARYAGSHNYGGISIRESNRR
jgi:hypothetical protein